MSTFQNVTSDDLNLTIDGVSIQVPAGGAFAIPDEYDSQVLEQPYYKHLSQKDAKGADAVVPPIAPPAPLDIPKPTESEPTVPAPNEGDN